MTAVAKIVRETVAERTVAQLRDQILGGELRPGNTVTEEALAAQFGVSRPTVRQALNTLELSGLLTRNSSTRVLEVTTLSTQDIVEIYRARRFLELGGVDAAAGRTADELASIQQAVIEMGQAVAADDMEAFVQADYRCHVEVVALLRSSFLSRAHAELLAKLRLAITQVTVEEQDNKMVFERHQEFWRLLSGGRVAEARTNLEQRLLEAEQSILPKATVTG